MKVELRLSPQRPEPTVVLEVPELTAEMETLAEKLRAVDLPLLTGWQADRAYPLDPAELVRIYAQDKGVYAENAAGERYLLKLRLYELEERLDRHTFVRISHSEIVNLKQVTALDLTLSGTIKMTLTGGPICWVSRRNVKKLKAALNL